jgi:hypothetical protein
MNMKGSSAEPFCCPEFIRRAAHTDGGFLSAAAWRIYPDTDNAQPF